MNHNMTKPNEMEVELIISGKTIPISFLIINS